MVQQLSIIVDINLRLASCFHLQNVTIVTYVCTVGNDIFKMHKNMCVIPIVTGSTKLPVFSYMQVFINTNNPVTLTFV